MYKLSLLDARRAGPKEGICRLALELLDAGYGTAPAHLFEMVAPRAAVRETHAVVRELADEFLDASTRLAGPRERLGLTEYDERLDDLAGAVSGGARRTRVARPRLRASRTAGFDPSAIDRDFLIRSCAAARSSRTGCGGGSPTATSTRA